MSKVRGYHLGCRLGIGTNLTLVMINKVNAI